MSADKAEVNDLLAKAISLHQLGQFREAQLACVAVLGLEPDNLRALMRYALIMHETSRYAAAIETYKRVLELDPRNLFANVNLASIYRKDHQAAEAVPLLKTALEVDPDCQPAQSTMAQALSDLRDTKGGWEYTRKLWRNAVFTFPYDGPPGEEIVVLILCAWQSVNTPLDHALDRRVFRQVKLNVDFHDPAQPLPFHHLVWNAIGEIEIGAEHLVVSERLLKLTRAPILNPPSKIWPTGRADNAQRLEGIPGLIVPKIVNFKRELLEGADAADRLRGAGFSFPLLIRAAGFQGGLNFEKVDAPEDLGSALASMPGEELVVLEFVDARDADGKIRKYRAMMIDGRLYPLHAAVSENWKIHYFSAGMRDNPEHRAEDRAYLEDMEKTLGPKAIAALKGVQKTLGLDYGGIDFSLSRDGGVIFFESNATMVVPRPPSAEVWDYRRAPVQRILDAVTAMLRARAGNAARRVPAPQTYGKKGGNAPGDGPPPLELRLAKAAGMHKFGNFKEAKREYAAVLTENPNHVKALMNYGSLMLETGACAAAAEVYGRAVELEPGNAAAQSDLGLALLALNRGADARVHFEAALAVNPKQAAAHQGLADLAIAAGDLKTAREHGRQAYSGKSHYELPYRGNGHASNILVLWSALGANAPIPSVIDRRGFRQTLLVVEYHDPGEPLPLHDMLFSSVGGPDDAPEALALAVALAKRCSAQMLNPPEKVARSGRAENARRLSGVPGLRVPKAAEFTRAELEGTDAGALLKSRGPGFPLLLRRRGLGRRAATARLDSADGLPAALESLGGTGFIASEFLDARDADGKVSKYRVLGVARRLYPIRAVVSDAGTADQGHAKAMADELAFLKDMPAVLGAKAMAALTAVQEILDLDYVGLDFSLSPAGEVLFYASDPAMPLSIPQEGAKWDHLREPARRAIEAVNDLLRSKQDAQH